MLLLPFSSLPKHLSVMTLDGEEIEIMMTITIIRVEYSIDTILPQQKNTICLPPGWKGKEKFYVNIKNCKKSIKEWGAC